MKAAIVFLLLLLIFPAALAATTHTVGGSAGWGFNVNYDTWASGQTFTTGDSLVFNYASFHSVDEVSQSDYQNCNSANPINSYSPSPTTIPLTAAGTRYFICPTTGHCAAGMKLAVTVAAASTGSSPPAGGSTPSPPSITPATPGNGPSTTTPSPPPPPSGSAATTTAVAGLVAGTSVVMAALFGMMG